MIDRRHPPLGPLVSLALLATPACDDGEPHDTHDAMTTTTTSTDGTTDAGTTGGASDSVFAREIQPILDAKCAICHGPIGGQLGLVLGPSTEVDPDDIAAGMIDVPSTVAPLDLVEPGAPDDSWLVRKITGDFSGVTCDGGCGGPMPPAGTPLTDTELAALRTWIADGAEVLP